VYSGKEPELIEGDVFKTIVPLPKLDENMEDYDGNRVGIDGNSDGNSDGNEGNIEGNLVPLPANPLLSLLRDNPTVTYAELALRLGISEATVTRQIKKLKESKKIKRIGSTHGKWIVTEN
jgi:ATP-dependent DNA helicase RecG